MEEIKDFKQQYFMKAIPKIFKKHLQVCSSFFSNKYYFILYYTYALTNVTVHRSILLDTSYHSLTSFFFFHVTMPNLLHIANDKLYLMSLTKHIEFPFIK